VNGGHLYTIFAYSDDVEAKCNEIGLKFLYSESTWR
jgi:hypothetical protein